MPPHRSIVCDIAAAIRAKPEAERTEREKEALSGMSMPIGMDTYDFEDTGISDSNGFFYPPSPAREPFASLFLHAPAVARELVRTLSNRATTAWRQIHEINAPPPNQLINNGHRSKNGPNPRRRVNRRAVRAFRAVEWRAPENTIEAIMRGHISGVWTAFVRLLRAWRKRQRERRELSLMLPRTSATCPCRRA